MAVTKLAISVPADTIALVDGAAKRLGITRSRYISVVLARVARAERDRAISRKVDEVLASLHKQDLRSVARLHAVRRDEGTEW